MGAVIGAFVVVALVLIGGWYVLFRPAPDFDLTADQQRRFDACVAAFHRIDANAYVPLRPVFQDLIGWPYGGDFTIHGERTSASCSLDATGNVVELTIAGKEVAVPAKNARG